jgi:hypothetical protein
MRTSARSKRWLRIVLCISAGALLAIAAIAAFLVIRFQPIARQYFISTLQSRYRSEVELGNLQISLYPTVRATGDNLVFWFNGSHEGPPLVRMRRFSFEAGLFNFFRTPKHINHLRLEGLEIHIPPRSGQSAAGNSGAPASTSANTSLGTAAFVLDEVIADGTSLEIAPRDPAKNPLIFEIAQLTLRTVGVGLPMAFHAGLTNPRPPGIIRSDGQFGPWNAARPVDTPLSGTYTFRDADLSVFKGITGKLSSDGRFTGQLGRLEVQGTTDTPDFALTVGGHPMPLHTDYQATVDGTNGNTVLHPVHARLARSEFEVSGTIDREPTKRDAVAAHKTILLDAKTGAGVIGAKARIEDFLRLSVRGEKPPMTGGIRFDAKVKIPPGETEVVERLQLDGTFGLTGVKFTSPDVQGKIAGLSHRAQGDPNDHDPDVTANFEGQFHLHNGQLGLPDLRFTLPGANVSLHGNYTLRSGALSFQGTVKLDATVSQMTTGVKSKLLRPLDPLFRRGDAGTVLPIAISGTRGEPSFRLDIGRILRRD